MMCIRYNYIYAFCQQFYCSLVDQRTIREAFTQASKFVQQDDTLNDLIWENRDYDNIQIEITPVLLDESNKKHDQKIFDTEALEQEKSYISKGRLYDISQERGLLVNMKKIKDPYIGNQCMIYKAVHHLTDEKDIRHITHISGNTGMGKTRLLKEIGNYLHRRFYFR